MNAGEVLISENDFKQPDFTEKHNIWSFLVIGTMWIVQKGMLTISGAYENVQMRVYELIIIITKNNNGNTLQ